MWLKGGAALAAQETDFDGEDYLPAGAQQEVFPDVHGVYEVRGLSCLMHGKTLPLGTTIPVPYEHGVSCALKMLLSFHVNRGS